MTPKGARIRQIWATSLASLGKYFNDGNGEVDRAVLDYVLAWRNDDPRYIDPTKGRIHMQRQWTIEARADYADPGKNEVLSEAIRVAAVHIHATMELLNDGVKPQVVAFSDDFFTGHQEISLIKNTKGDVLGDAIKTHNGDGTPDDDESVSLEMLQAVREMTPPK